MSQYKPYAAYKDSGVEWLGRVPEHWECARFDAKTITHRDSIEADRLNGLRVMHYSIPAVQEHGCAQEEDGSEIDSNKLVVRQRQLLVSKLNPHKQTLVVADSSDSRLAIASTEFVPLIPVAADLGYITYIWSSAYCQHYLLARCESSTRSHQRVAPSDITRMSWVWPDLDEQAAIARALDHETARIDALIEKKTRFIELLREKRQALITQAVTKGLDRSVKMKDSGVEWLGEVPEHWSFGRLAYACELIVDGTHHSPESYPEGAFKYITAKNIKEHGFDFTELTYLSADQHQEIYSRCSVKAGDVLYIKDGATAGVAMVNYLDEEFSLLSSVAVIRPKKKRLLSEYLAYLLNSGGFKTSVLSRLVGGAITRFTLEMIGNFSVSLPSIEEQRQVVAHLEGIVPRLDVLKGKTERSIELLKERRSALITAAVTGQIDLREAV